MSRNFLRSIFNDSDLSEDLAIQINRVLKGSRKLYELICSPILSKCDKIEIAAQMPIDNLVKDVIRITIECDMNEHILNILTKLKDEICVVFSMCIADLIATKKISDLERSKVIDDFYKDYGKKLIIASESVNMSIIGGIILISDKWKLDLSIKGDLIRIKNYSKIIMKGININ